MGEAKKRKGEPPRNAKRKRMDGQTPLPDIYWQLEFHATREAIGGEKQLDLYWLSYAFDGRGISLAVPHGRKDIAEFVITAIIAGAKVLRQLPPGVKFDPQFRE